MPAAWSPGVASAGTVTVKGMSARVPGSSVTVLPTVAAQAASPASSLSLQTVDDESIVVHDPTSVEASSAPIKEKAAVL